MLARQAPPEQAGPEISPLKKSGPPKPADFTDWAAYCQAKATAHRNSAEKSLAKAEEWMLKSTKPAPRAWTKRST